MQPSHAVAIFLRKSARIGSSSFFSEKKKLKSFEAVCVEHCWARSRDCKLVRCYAKRQSALPASRMRSRAQKDKNQICAGYAAAPSWKRSTSPKETKIHPPQHLPPTATANAKSRAAGSKLPVECSAELKRLLRCRCKPELP